MNPQFWFCAHLCDHWHSFFWDAIYDFVMDKHQLIYFFRTNIRMSTTHYLCLFVFFSFFIKPCTQQTFQRCFNVAFWLMRRHDVRQCQINVETTLCISTLKFTTSNNVESTLCISTLTWTTLDNVETTLSFSTSSFTTLVKVETTLWKWPLLKRTKK